MQFVKKPVGEEPYLTALVPEHVGFWYRWHNDSETALQATSPGSEDNFCGTIESFLERNRHLFLIVESETDEPVGWCNTSGHVLQ